jgi:dTDP-4-dehydrorhamnose 3,5-epimerase-like enzyme
LIKERGTMALHYESLRVHSDARGLVFEPLDVKALASQRNAHVVISLPGVVRGNHYHPQGEETMGVLGPARVRVREAGGMRDIEVPEGEAFRFTFPPGMSHAIQNLGVAANVLVAFNTEVHDPERPDVIRDVLIPDALCR